MASPFGPYQPYLEQDPSTGEVRQPRLQRPSGVTFRSSSRTPRGAGGTTRRYDTPKVGDSIRGIADAMQGIEDQYAAEEARLRSGYSLPSLAGYQDAINSALELLNDVKGNRAAITGVYDEYDQFTQPLADEAVQAALGMVAEVAPELGGIHQTAMDEAAGSFDDATAAVDAAAELIGAGQGVADTVNEDVTDGEELRLQAIQNQSESARQLLHLTSAAAEKEAFAQGKLDQNEMERRAKLLDIEFEDMQEAAQAQLDAARRAAAAARARRAAMARQRDAALAELRSEKAQALRLNPHEAGEATALRYLGDNAKNLDYNRQQLIVSTLSNAISEQVPSASIGRWATENQIPLTSQEKHLVVGGLRAYTTGMRTQQNLDRVGEIAIPGIWGR